MWKKSDESQLRPSYGITPQAFIILGWLVMLAATMLAEKIIFQWLAN